MKLKSFIIFLLCVILTHSNYVAAAEEELKFSVSDKTRSAKAVPGQIIAEIKSGVIDLGEERGVVPADKIRINSESLDELNKKFSLVSVERLFSGTRKDAPSDIYVFTFPSETDINEILSFYKKDANIFYAEPNYIVGIDRSKPH